MKLNYQVKTTKIVVAVLAVIAMVLAVLISTSQTFANTLSDEVESSEPKQTIVQEQNGNKAVAVYNSSSSTMKFYYDSKDHSSEGTVYEVPKSTYGKLVPWWGTALKVNTVTIDSTFKSFRVANCIEWFSGFSNLTSINNISNINIDASVAGSDPVSLRSMFYGCEKLTSLDLRGLNTSSITDFSDMFRNCKILSSINLSNFNTSNADNMSSMFYGCAGLTSLDCSSFRTGNATNMRDMFDSCTNLTTLNVSNFDTKNAYVECMFQNCGKLVSITLPKQFVIAKNNISTIWLFDGCSSLSSIDCSRFKITGDTYSLTGFFKGCSSLTSLDLSTWNITNVYNFSEMFEDCSSLASITMPKTLCSTRGAGLYRAFLNCRGLKVIDCTCFAYYDGTKIDSSLSEAFKGCSSLTTIYAPENADWTGTWGGTSKVFEGCTSLKGGKGTKYDAGKITTDWAVVDGYKGKPGYFTFAGKPTNVKATGAAASIKLTWTAGRGCTKYAIATQNDDGKTYTTHTDSCTTTSYTITGLEDNKTYKCVVQGYVGGKWTNFDSSDLVSCKTLNSRPILKATASGDGKVTLGWGAIKGASNYVAYEIVGSTFKQIGNILPSSKTSLIVNDLANGYQHTFLVQAKIGDQWSKFSEKNYASATPTGTTKPKISSAKVSGTSIKLTWKHVPGASVYAVATKVGGSSYTTHTMDCTKETYTISNLEESVTYDCLVQANINGKWSTFDSGDLKQATTKGTRPVVTAKASGDGVVTLSWGSIAGADKYAAYEVIGGSFKAINESIPSSTCKVKAKDLANGYQHTFLVQAHVGGSWSNFSEKNYAYATPTGTVKPKISSASVSGTNITLKWKKVPGASKYAIATKVGSSGYTTYSTDVTGLTYTIKGLEDGVTYDCLVQANINGNWSAFDSSDLKQATTKNTRPAPKATTGNGSVTLTWDAISGASKYVAYEIINGQYVQIGSQIPASTTKVTKKDLVNEQQHTFLVQAFVGGSWSNFSEKNYVYATPRGAIKPAIKSSSSTANTITVKWNKVSGSDGYCAAISTDGVHWQNFMLDKTATKYTFTNLTPSTNYKILVQRRVGDAWSSYTSTDINTIATKAK